MKIHEKTTANKVGKALAVPLSRLLVNSMTEKYVRLFEAYLCILQGKGAGSGWALDAETRTARSVMSPAASVIFDVGANIGEWSDAMHKVYPQARIFLFEPQKKCQQVIRERNIPGYVLIPNIVSSETGLTVKLFSDGELSRKASMHQRRDSYFISNPYTATDVETIAIDDVIREHKIERVDFMKMDVEGHELEVLKGAAHSLKHGVISALSFEFGSGNINSQTFFHDFWDLLTPHGYKIYRILPSSRLMHIDEYYEDCEYFRGVTNYIAVLKQRDV